MVPAAFQGTGLLLAGVVAYKKWGPLGLVAWLAAILYLLGEELANVAAETPQPPTRP